MATPRGLERLIFFTDAVTAIAITLLILPLVDAVPDAGASGMDVGEFLVEHTPELGGFVISFAVIARLWVAHHSLFEHVRSYNGRLMTLSLLWAFSIVLLPLPTALVSQFSPSPITVGFYIGTMAASSLSLTLITVSVRGNPGIEDPSAPISSGTLIGSVTTTVDFGLAFVLGTFIPVINYWALFVLFLSVPVGRYLRRRALRRESDGSRS